jgi:hypothetical protein
VRVRVSSTEYLADLIEFLADRGCVVEQAGEREVEVGSLSSLRYEYAHLDVAHHVQAWAKTHPGVITELVPE